MKILVGLFLLLTFSPVVFAQSESPFAKQVASDYAELSDPEKKLLVQYLSAKTSMGFCGYVPDGTGCKENNYEKQYRDALDQIIKSPKLTNYILARSVKNYEALRMGAKSAPQISQIADEQNAELLRLMVAQNNEIIELLRQIAKKPK